MFTWRWIPDTHRSFDGGWKWMWKRCIMSRHGTTSPAGLSGEPLSLYVCDLGVAKWFWHPHFFLQLYSWWYFRPTTVCLSLFDLKWFVVLWHCKSKFWVYYTNLFLFSQAQILHPSGQEVKQGPQAGSGLRKWDPITLASAQVATASVPLPPLSHQAHAHTDLITQNSQFAEAKIIFTSLLHS